MRILIFFFILSHFTTFSQRTNSSLQYQLTHFGNKIHVDLIYTPLENDSVKFTYGNLDYGGQKDIFRGVQNLAVKGQMRMEIDTAQRSIRMFYKSFAPIFISYDIVDTRSETTTRSQLFRPMITENYFFVHGFNLFLTPQFRKEFSKVRVSVRWKKRPSFPIFYTFDPDNDGSRVSLSTLDSLNFRFLTGATDLKVKKFYSESGKNFLVLRTGAMNDSIEKGLEKFYLNYNAVMREYWEDSRIINYSLVLQPYIGVKHPISGVSFGNGFIGKYTFPDSLLLGERLFVLAHEIGHYYLSDVAAEEGENNIGQWFNEGFNDYLTYTTLLQSKQLSVEEFQREFNGLFNSLYKSEIRNTPNNKIFENFWKLGDYSRLPYWRGCVYAFYLDNQISIRSNNKFSLHDLMLDLKKLVTSKEKKEFNSSEFLQVLSKYINPEQCEKDFRQYIVEGISIPFNQDCVLAMFTMGTKGDVPMIEINDKAGFMQHYKIK